jgi:hypothetical protein
LLCNLYRATNYSRLPQTRPLILERAALVLYERWDSDRAISNVEFERDFMSALAYVAWSMLFAGETRDSISQTGLLELIAGFLVPHRMEDADEAYAFARTLVDHCAGRAWVFTDVGTAATGEPLFQFTHRTFLEFFCAVHFVRSTRTASDLFDEMANLLEGAVATELCMLAFQLKARQTDDGADEFFSSLLKHADSLPGRPRERLLFFASQCAGVVILTPGTLRALTQTIWRGVYESEERVTFVFQLLDSVRDNRRVIARHMAPLVMADLRSQARHKRQIARRIGERLVRAVPDEPMVADVRDLMNRTRSA